MGSFLTLLFYFFHHCITFYQYICCLLPFSSLLSLHTLLLPTISQHYTIVHTIHTYIHYLLLPFLLFLELPYSSPLLYCCILYCPYSLPPPLPPFGLYALVRLLCRRRLTAAHYRPAGSCCHGSARAFPTTTQRCARPGVRLRHHAAAFLRCHPPLLPHACNRASHCVRSRLRVGYSHAAQFVSAYVPQRSHMPGSACLRYTTNSALFCRFS